jgi:hypothetical protein
MVGYLLRGLSLDRRTGAVRSRGTVKLSWIETTLGVSERAARYARAELVRLGWIARDLGSHQRKLNRDGAYFHIDLSWNRQGIQATAPETQAKNPGRAGDTPLRGENAPRRLDIARRFAPPRERPETPYGSKDQRTRRAEPAGVSLKRVLGKPDLRNINRDDLKSFQRTEELYWQAVGKGIIKHSESNALNWLSAADRANYLRDGDPVRVFVTIVRRQLWSHITQEQEERARLALSRAREENPSHFRERQAA